MYVGHLLALATSFIIIRSAALLYFIVMTYVVIGILHEVRPLCAFLGSLLTLLAEII